MKRILILILGLFGVAQAQFAPTSAKTAFKNGVSLGTRDSSAYVAADSLVVVINRQGRMMYRSTDGYWKVLANAAAADYVPYTGAVTNVNLGNFRLTARSLSTDSIYANGSGGLHLVSNSGTQVALLGAGGGAGTTFYGGIVGTTGSFASSGSGTTFAINHSSGSGIGLNITKGGNGEGLYINKTSGSGNAATIVGTLEATTLVKTGGTSSQFLKADGSVDGTAYGTGSVTSVATNTGSGITGGTITTSGTIAADTTILSTRAYVTGQLVGYATTGSLAGKLNISDTATMLSNYRRKTTLIENADLRNSAITINGSSTSLGGSISVGTVTSVGLSVPTGFSVSNTPITSSGTLGLSFTAGYSLPTTASQALWDIAYNKRVVSAGLSSSQLTLTLGDASTVTASVPTFNQNTTGTAASLSAVLSKTLGGAGDVSGILKANGSGVVSAAVAGDITSLISGTYLPLSGGTLTGALSGTSLSMSGDAISARLFAQGTAPLVQAYSPTGTEAILRAYSGTNYWDWSVASSTLNFKYNETTKVSIANDGALSGTSLSMSGGAQLATSSGNVLIKTTTESPNNEALQVAGSGLFTGAVKSSGGSFLAEGYTSLPTTGSLVAMGFTGGVGYVQSWSGNAQAPISIDGSSFQVRVNNYATTALSIAATTGAATFSSSVKAAGLIQPISIKTSNYTLTANDYTVIFDVSGGNRTATLPAGVEGQIFVIKIKGSANNLNVNPNGSETIEGVSSWTIFGSTCGDAAYTFQFVSGNWYIISSHIPNCL